jgi:hypothetical protein
MLLATATLISISMALVVVFEGRRKAMIGIANED